MKRSDRRLAELGEFTAQFWFTVTSFRQVNKSQFGGGNLGEATELGAATYDTMLIVK